MVGWDSGMCSECQLVLAILDDYHPVGGLEENILPSLLGCSEFPDQLLQ